MATLEQIAAALKAADAAGNVDDARRLAAAYREMQASSAQGQPDQQAQPPAPAPPAAQPQQQLPTDLVTSTAATVNGLVQSIPFLQNVTDMAGGGIAQLMGGDYQQYIDRQQKLREQIAQAAPVARVAGEVGGAVAGLGALGTTRLGAEALGMTGKLGRRMTNSALSSAGLSTADALSRGETGEDALKAGALGGGVGGLIPGVGAVARVAGRGISDNIVRPIATMANRGNEATQRLSRAIAQDQASGAVLSAVDDRLAQRAGAEVVNADRFGDATRTLARTAANVSPEASNTLTNLTQQRFMTQGTRAQGFVRKLMNGATDDLRLQEGLRTTAARVNDAAYRAAYEAAPAKAIWTPEIRNLFAADPFKAAVRNAEKTAANYAAVTGQKAIRNPFIFDESGNLTGLRDLPGGGKALPNLEFWDIVQRNLRTMADQASRGGDNLAASQIGNMRRQLLSSLDGAVPEFRKARQGAAAFFGAEDALDAGRKAWNSPRETPEIRKAVAAMKPEEKEAFAVGFASEMMDAISASRDRVNVINSLFGSDSARQRIAIALGPQKARELEAFVRVEQTLDMLRNAVQGNSTTAKQLIAAGVLGGGGGLLFSGGDIGQATSWAFIAGAGRRGLQMLGKRVDDEVMTMVAKALASSDPKAVERAIQNAALSKQHMEALEAIMRGIGVGARGAALTAVGD